jgi:hypothetical protein
MLVKTIFFYFLTAYQKIKNVELASMSASHALIAKLAAPAQAGGRQVLQTSQIKSSILC